MTRTRALILAALLFTRTPAAQAAPIPGLFNTGVDALGATIADGAVDPHYQLIVSADPAYPGPNAIACNPIAAGYWTPNTATSRWIAPNLLEGYPSNSTPHPGGNYVYRLTFDLTGFLPATASISGTYGGDNGASIKLNGAATGAPGAGYSPLQAFTISTGFVAGVNHLDFVVNNQASGGANPTGLRVDGLSGSATSAVGVDDAIPGPALELSVPVPNPARGLARLFYALPRSAMVRLRVVDLAGRTVRTLVARELPAGRHEASWDGSSGDGVRVAAGVYFAVLESPDSRTSRMLIRLQ